MSDLFHDDIPDGFVAEVFDVMLRATQHTFQILTKRAERLEQLAPHLPWPRNVWMGVSVESGRYLGRIEHLRATNAAVKFLSLEPLLGPLSQINLREIDWVIAGGESGPGARPVRPEWIVGIRDACAAQNVAFFFKQWGGVRKKANGRLLEGRTHDEMPAGGRRLDERGRGTALPVWRQAAGERQLRDSG